MMWRVVDKGRFHAPTKTLFDLQVPITKRLNTGLKRRRRRLVGGPGFERMRVATLVMIFHVTTRSYTFLYIFMINVKFYQVKNVL